MDIANNWTIVVGIATIISMVLLWSKEAYLNPVLEHETNLVTKVRDDINNLISNSPSIISKNGEEKLAEDLYNLATLKKNIRHAKTVFRHKMIPMGIGIVLLTVFIISLWEFKDKNPFFTITIVLIAYILLLLVIALGSNFFRIARYENEISRYIEGDDPKLIFEK